MRGIRLDGRQPSSWLVTNSPGLVAEFDVAHIEAPCHLARATYTPDVAFVVSGFAVYLYVYRPQPVAGQPSQVPQRLGNVVDQINFIYASSQFAALVPIPFLLPPQQQNMVPLCALDTLVLRIEQASSPAAVGQWPNGYLRLDIA